MIAKLHSAGVAALLAAGLVFSASAGAGAQEAKEEGVAGDWIYTCQVPESGSRECVLSQTLVAQETRKPIGRINIGRDQKSTTLMLAVLLPLGLDIPRGVQADIDDRVKLILRIETCVPSGCIARTPLDKKAVDSLKRGNRLNVGFRMQGGTETLFLPGSLTGISSGLASTGLE